MSNIMSNVAATQSAKKVEGGDGLKTLECLRGRLLSERVASKTANEEADKYGNKLMELEKKLQEEVKRRNRAEKRLKSQIKKLESMKLVYLVSDESLSEHSSSMGKSELTGSLSSSSSTASCFSYSYKQPEYDDKKKPNSQIIKSSESEPVKENGTTLPEILMHTDPNIASSENQSFSSNDKINLYTTVSEKSDDGLQCTQFCDDAKHDDHRSESADHDKETNGEQHQDWDESSVDNSMALVPVDSSLTTQTTIATIEPLQANNTEVKDVLDTLKYVKERLQTSMVRRHMIRVGF